MSLLLWWVVAAMSNRSSPYAVMWDGPYRVRLAPPRTLEIRLEMAAHAALAAAEVSADEAKEAEAEAVAAAEAATMALAASAAARKRAAAALTEARIAVSAAAGYRQALLAWAEARPAPGG